MSSRARRITAVTGIVPWSQSTPASPASAPRTGNAGAAEPAADGQAIERELFAKAFAQGERAGAAAALEQNSALMKQLSHTLDDLLRVRTEMIRHTERQMVQLSLAVARRIVHREVSLDQDLLLAMIRVALDRLSESARVTIRLHPAEFEAVSVARAGLLAGDHVTVVPDPRVGRGGCRVESEYGDIDAGVDAQIQEVARALLGEQEAPAHDSVA